MSESPPPDGCEKCLRFGCGSVFGGILVFLVLAKEIAGEDFFWPCVVGGTVLCGLLAVKMGDGFYEYMLDLFRPGGRW